MVFRQLKDAFGQIDPTAIQYTDDSGVVWFVPAGHRFWDLY